MQMPCRKKLSLRLQPLPTVLGVILAAMALVPADAFAQGAPPPKIDTGDTAWMLASTALVLVMTIPGVALLYGGMVRKKNVLAITMQVFAICCLVTVLWMIIGYSLAFTEATPFIGGLSRIFLNGMG
ncbi:MAG: ammonia channel protein, partial [Proteobacteria bacterium]|nr:ammonia channel protein [Pseudomonadota bacterium]